MAVNRQPVRPLACSGDRKWQSVRSSPARRLKTHVDRFSGPVNQDEVVLLDMALELLS